MAKARERSPDKVRSELFTVLREQKDAIVAIAVKDTDIAAERLEPAFDEVLDLVSEPVPSAAQLDRWREHGVALAREGVASERVFDACLSLSWAIWGLAMGAERIDRAVILDFADRLLRGLDDAIAAISEGYVRVELEAAAAHSHRRRAVLEEMLVAPRSTPEDRARIRLRAERHGLSPGGTYRLILIALPGTTEEEVEVIVDQLELRIRVPSSSHHAKPGIGLPVVLDWRGRVLVFARADRSGERRLREAVLALPDDVWLAVDTGPIEGIEAVAESLVEAEYSTTVAQALGRRGWIGDPRELALETTFLLDQQLVRTVIENELGPLLSDPRMGEELIETLEVYLGSRQNTREAARRLHLAPRTVTYRLERIESLLGRDLDGDAAARLGAALLALRVSRQAGFLGKESDGPTG